MRLLDEHAPWLQKLSVSEFGSAVGEGGRFGIGALLVVERACSRELLFVRKAYRLGFAGNGQLAFPGGMIRPSEPHASIESWIRSSLTTRAAAEVGLDLHSCGEISPLDGMPPVVAVYTAKGRRRHTVILPFTLSLAQVFRPWAQDSTVYDPEWRDPRKLWSEITPTNRLITAYYLWSTPRLNASAI
ncbi:MAG TPA: hypothetical protein VGX03_29545 [Candidatus Binatia bacterium]|jgi:8-oxo-dGTP pyrophosphatase MutT (NUDIX family)|nr:hypothetical protein [Candidatus Binatia bacterium]